MEDVNVPPSSSYMEFSPNIIDSLSSPKHNSFGVRDCWQQDSYSGKRNSLFGHRIEDKWNGRYTFFISLASIFTILIWILVFLSQTELCYFTDKSLKVILYK